MILNKVTSLFKGLIRLRVLMVFLFILTLGCQNLLLSIEVEYEWLYKERKYKFYLTLSDKLYEDYSKRSRFREYDLFATDSVDDEIISQITEEFKSIVNQKKFNKKELPYFVIAFVQSLEYIDDLSSTGKEEYPKYPFETLYDGGGDCEDSSILISALLLDLNYDIGLLEFTNHMAVAIYGNNLSGFYITYNNKKYYYLETTGGNFKIGELPDEFRGSKLTFIPLKKRPFFSIEFNSSFSYTSDNIELKTDVNIHNIGSEVCNNAVIEILVKNKYGKILSQIRSKPKVIFEEENIEFSPIPANFKFERQIITTVSVLTNGKVLNQLKGDWITLDNEVNHSKLHNMKKVKFHK